MDSETNRRLEELQNLLSNNGFVGYQTKKLPNHITLGTFRVEEEEQLIKKLRRLQKNSKALM